MEKNDYLFDISPRNLYFMLTYVTCYPNQIYKVEIEGDYDGDFINLLSKVIIQKLDDQIKRSASENYLKDLIENDDMDSKIIDFEVIQQSRDINPRFSYMNDFLTYDNIYNQIIKRTLNLLINYKYLKEEYEWAFVDIYNHLREVSYLRIDKTTFDELIMHKYNKSYEYILKLCEFIWCDLNISDSCGKSEFLELVTAPEKLTEFIQKFLKGFYREETFKNPKDELAIDISTIDFTKDWVKVRCQLISMIEQ